MPPFAYNSFLTSKVYGVHIPTERTVQKFDTKTRAYAPWQLLSTYGVHSPVRCGAYLSSIHGAYPGAWLRCFLRARRTWHGLATSPLRVRRYTVQITMQFGRHCSFLAGVRTCIPCSSGEATLGNLLRFCRNLQALRLLLCVCVSTCKVAKHAVLRTESASSH